MGQFMTRLKCLLPATFQISAAYQPMIGILETAQQYRPGVCGSGFYVFYMLRC